MSPPHNPGPVGPGTGADRPVLLVHGFATSARQTWQEPGWFDLLGDAGRPVIAPDLLGHGHAPKPHDPEAYRDVEKRVADELPSDRPVDAIGYSAGAVVVLTLAAADPERFDRIVLGGVGGGLVGHGRPGVGSAELARAVESAGGDLADAAEVDPVALRFQSMARQGDNDPLALAAFLRRERTPLEADRLASVTNPVLVILGDQDFAAPGQPLVDALPNAELAVLPRVDHFGLVKDFGFVDRALEFIGAQPFG